MGFIDSVFAALCHNPAVSYTALVVVLSFILLKIASEKETY